MEIVKKIVSALNKFECSIWFDDEHEEDLTGDQWAKIRSILERSRHLIPIITHTYIDRFNEDKEPQGCGVANLTKQALAFMYPDYSNNKRLLREGAEEFVCPIFTENERYICYSQELCSPCETTLTWKRYTSCIDNGYLPAELKTVNVCRYDVGAEITDGPTAIKIKKLIGTGKTMKELGYKL